MSALPEVKRGPGPKRIAMKFTIKDYNCARGFGFCENPKGNKFFFHVSSCSFIPEVGQEVEGALAVGRKGGLVAVELKLVGTDFIALLNTEDAEAVDLLGGKKESDGGAE